MNTAVSHSETSPITDVERKALRDYYFNHEDGKPGWLSLLVGVLVEVPVDKQDWNFNGQNVNCRSDGKKQRCCSCLVTNVPGKKILCILSINRYSLYNDRTQWNLKIVIASIDCIRQPFPSYYLSVASSGVVVAPPEFIFKRPKVLSLKKSREKSFAEMSSINMSLLVYGQVAKPGQNRKKRAASQ